MWWCGVPWKQGCLRLLSSGPLLGRSQAFVHGTTGATGAVARSLLQRLGLPPLLC